MGRAKGIPELAAVASASRVPVRMPGFDFFSCKLDELTVRPTCMKKKSKLGMRTGTLEALATAASSGIPLARPTAAVSDDSS